MQCYLLSKTLICRPLAHFVGLSKLLLLLTAADSLFCRHCILAGTDTGVVTVRSLAADGLDQLVTNELTVLCRQVDQHILLPSHFGFTSIIQAEIFFAPHFTFFTFQNTYFCNTYLPTQKKKHFDKETESWLIEVAADVAVETKTEVMAAVVVVVVVPVLVLLKAEEGTEVAADKAVEGVVTEVIEEIAVAGALMGLVVVVVAVVTVETSGAVSLATVESIAATIEAEAVVTVVVEVDVMKILGKASPSGNYAHRVAKFYSLLQQANQKLSIDGSVPSPDLAVTKLEDERMQAQSSSVSQLSSGMKKLDVGDKGGTDQFPLRPAFGNNGRAVVLWTNYFQLHVKPVTFYKYTLEAVQVGTVYKGPETPGQKPEGKQKNGEVKGRKLHLAFQQALTQLIVGDEALVLASEFKSQLITLKKLDLAQTPIKVYVPVESKPGVADVIKITFDGPAEAPVEGLLRYLKSMEDGPGDHTFPRYPDVVSALNVVLGHRPRSQLDKISALSSAAFLPFGPGEKIQNLFSSFHALVAVRGAFQSARLGTGRILLNTNVIHRVFKPSGRLHELMASMNIRAVPIGDVRGMRNLKAFAKFLPKTRVWVDFTLHDGTKVRRTKAIHNLAASWDFRRNNDHPPKFQQDYVYGGPKNISFWLGEKGGGRYITVYEHFKQSKSYWFKLKPTHALTVLQSMEWTSVPIL